MVQDGTTSMSAHRDDQFVPPPSVPRLTSPGKPIAVPGEQILRVQPTQVMALPACLARVRPPVAEQEGADVLTLAAVILNRHGPRPHQVPHGLVCLVGNP